MFLKIISLKGVDYESNVNSLNVKTESGEITVLDNHRPLITILKKGVARAIDSKNNTHEFSVESGFLEVHPSNKVTLLID